LERQVGKAYGKVCGQVPQKDEQQPSALVLAVLELWAQFVTLVELEVLDG
jgi:hypothetical protein